MTTEPLARRLLVPMPPDIADELTEPDGPIRVAWTLHLDEMPTDLSVLLLYLVRELRRLAGLDVLVVNPVPKGRWTIALPVLPLEAVCEHGAAEKEPSDALPPLDRDVARAVALDVLERDADFSRLPERLRKVVMRAVVQYVPASSPDPTGPVATEELGLTRERACGKCGVLVTTTLECTSPLCVMCLANGASNA